MAAAKRKKEELPVKKDELLKKYLGQFDRSFESMSPNQVPLAELAVYLQLRDEFTKKGYAPTLLLLGKTDYYEGKSDKKTSAVDDVILVLQAGPKSPEPGKFLAVKITHTNPFKWENSGWVSKEKLQEYCKPDNMFTMTLAERDTQLYKPLKTGFNAKAYLKESDIPEQIRKGAKKADELYVNPNAEQRAKNEAKRIEWAEKRHEEEMRPVREMNAREEEHWKQVAERKAFIAFTLKPESPQMLGYVAGRDKDGVLIVKVKERNKLKRLFGKKVKDEIKVDTLQVDKVFEQNVKSKDIKLEDKGKKKLTT
ncbi:Uncharacterised protein [Candidatus Gugararchaeum adminiculabundum]|nr:Uncharacterised protein [Candidatus Gugararchaeum adminiculabundum]